MPVIQVRNAEAQALGSVDHLFYNDRNFSFEVYDTNTNTFTSTEVQPFATVRHNSAPEVFSYDGASILTLTEAGLYLFTYRMTFQSAGSTGNAECAMFLEQDPDTGTFATVTGTTAYAGIIQFLRQTVQVSTVLRAGINYRYRVSIIRTSGADAINAVGTSVLSVIRLFKNG